MKHEVPAGALMVAYYAFYNTCEFLAKRVTGLDHFSASLGDAWTFRAKVYRTIMWASKILHGRVWGRWEREAGLIDTNLRRFCWETKTVEWHEFSPKEKA